MYMPKNKRIRLKGKKLKTLNHDIHIRDHYQCVVCGQEIDEGEKFHHEPCGIYKSDEITKGVLLCEKHHYGRHFTKNALEIQDKCVQYLRRLYGEKGAKKE
jgi:hypothetical protein